MKEFSACDSWQRRHGVEVGGRGLSAINLWPIHTDVAETNAL